VHIVDSFGRDDAGMPGESWSNVGSSRNLTGILTSLAHTGLIFLRNELVLPRGMKIHETSEKV